MALDNVRISESATTSPIQMADNSVGKGFIFKYGVDIKYGVNIKDGVRY